MRCPRTRSPESFAIMYLYIDPTTDEVFYIGRNWKRGIFRLEDTSETEKCRRIHAIRIMNRAHMDWMQTSAPMMAELLIRYWRAIEDLWPAAVKRETRDEYSLMKSVGVLTMHNIAATVFEAARSCGKKITQISERQRSYFQTHCARPTLQLFSLI